MFDSSHLYLCSFYFQIFLCWSYIIWHLPYVYFFIYSYPQSCKIWLRVYLLRYFCSFFLCYLHTELVWPKQTKHNHVIFRIIFKCKSRCSSSQWTLNCFEYRWCQYFFVSIITASTIFHCIPFVDVSSLKIITLSQMWGSWWCFDFWVSTFHCIPHVDVSSLKIITLSHMWWIWMVFWILISHCIHYGDMSSLKIITLFHMWWICMVFWLLSPYVPLYSSCWCVFLQDNYSLFQMWWFWMMLWISIYHCTHHDDMSFLEIITLSRMMDLEFLIVFSVDEEKEGVHIDKNANVASCIEFVLNCFDSAEGEPIIKEVFVCLGTSFWVISCFLV